MYQRLAESEEKCVPAQLYLLNFKQLHNLTVQASSRIVIIENSIKTKNKDLTMPNQYDKITPFQLQQFFSRSKDRIIKNRS
jgi:hypothetical protein